MEKPGFLQQSSTSFITAPGKANSLLCQRQTQLILMGKSVRGVPALRNRDICRYQRLEPMSRIQTQSSIREFFFRASVVNKRVRKRRVVIESGGRSGILS